MARASASATTQDRLEKKRQDAKNYAGYVEALLTEQDVARIVGLSVSGVRRWRLAGIGPRAVKCESAVRYKPVDVQAWLDSRPSMGGECRPVEAQ